VQALSLESIDQGDPHAGGDQPGRADPVQWVFLTFLALGFAKATDATIGFLSEQWKLHRPPHPVHLRANVAVPQRVPLGANVTVPLAWFVATVFVGVRLMWLSDEYRPTKAVLGVKNAGRVVALLTPAGFYFLLGASLDPSLLHATAEGDPITLSHGNIPQYGTVLLIWSALLFSSAIVNDLIQKPRANPGPRAWTKTRWTVLNVVSVVLCLVLARLLNPHFKALFSVPAFLSHGCWPLGLTFTGAFVVGLSGLVGLTKSIGVVEAAT